MWKTFKNPYKHTTDSQHHLVSDEKNKVETAMSISDGQVETSYNKSFTTSLNQNGFIFSPSEPVTRGSIVLLAIVRINLLAIVSSSFHLLGNF